MSTSAIEKLASLPPALVLFTSYTGWINWQSSFYAMSCLWVALQIYFRVRKEYGKWKIRREVLGEDAMNWQGWLDKPFVLTLGCNIITSLLAWYGKLDSANYTLITLGTVGAYITGWTTKQVKGTPADRATTEGTTP